MEDFKFFPYSVIWEVTFACNMRCIHCGTGAGKMRPDELTTNEALALIDELTGLGAQEITLSGGEPLLRKDWRQLAERIKSNGVRSYIITNGYAVTPEDVDDFARLKFNDVGVSLDGTEKTHNFIRQHPKSWAQATNALKLMAENGEFLFCAVSQISNINLHELDEIRKILVDCGCRLWRIQLNTSTGRMKDYPDLVLSLDNYPVLIDEILELKRQDDVRIDVGENIGYYGCKGSALLDGSPYFGCYAGTRVAGIESDGNVKGCLSMPEEFVEGNIRDSSFTEIWNRPGAFLYNRKFTRETADGFCRECRYLPLCRGGCTTTSVSATGRRADNPYCIYRFEHARGIESEDNEMIIKLLNRFKPNPEKETRTA
ncbi:MAG: radical SAM protein [Candidatus Zixiibacteriota bacterium]|nr:MAG: radical SAM protein [candidate division Zixibacteria bacterium]